MFMHIVIVCLKKLINRYEKYSKINYIKVNPKENLFK